MRPDAAARSGSTLLYVSISATALLAWALCHPYQGLFHDATLYSLQALAHLYPKSLPHDVFLRFGSQDRFTAFSPIYATAISALGIDHAAALLTLLSQCALAAAALMLAWQCLPGRAAAAGVVLLIAMPCDYGPERIFACLEPFLTPRMLAEALTLGMLTATFKKRAALATLLGIAAVLIHPVMAMAGLAAIVVHTLSLRSFWVGSTGPLALGSLVLAASVAVLLRGRFDPDWFALVQARSPYLFMSDWSIDDWIRAGIASSTLFIAGLSLPASVARPSRVVLLTMLAGWALTFIAADLAHWILPTQLQSWRWQWLGSAASALVLPYLAYSLWNSGARGRSVVLALGAAWIFRDGSYALVAMLAALVLRLLPALDQRKEQLMKVGTVVLMGIALTWRIATDLEFTDVHYMNSALPLALRRAMSFAKDGALPALLVGLVLLVERRRSKSARWTLMLLLIVAIGAVLPSATAVWASRSYTDNLSAKFAAWRELIPPHAEVLWNESPLGAWVLLQRAHYLSGLQTSGLVFSRPAALEMERRVKMLAEVVPPGNFLQWSRVGLTLPMSPQGLKSVCQLGILQFLVTPIDLGRPPIAELSSEDWPVSRGLKLYSCST